MIEVRECIAVPKEEFEQMQKTIREQSELIVKLKYITARVRALVWDESVTGHIIVGSHTWARLQRAVDHVPEDL